MRSRIRCGSTGFANTRRPWRVVGRRRSEVCGRPSRRALIPLRTPGITASPRLYCRPGPTVFIPGPFARSVCGTRLRLRDCKHERRRRRESIGMQTDTQPAEPIVRPQAPEPIPDRAARVPNDERQVQRQRSGRSHGQTFRTQRASSRSRAGSSSSTLRPSIAMSFCSRKRPSTRLTVSAASRR
jgi:hypothetical protein